MIFGVGKIFKISYSMWVIELSQITESVSTNFKSFNSTSLLTKSSSQICVMLFINSILIQPWPNNYNQKVQATFGGLLSRKDGRQMDGRTDGLTDEQMDERTMGLGSQIFILVATSLVIYINDTIGLFPVFSTLSHRRNKLHHIVVQQV